MHNTTFLSITGPSKTTWSMVELPSEAAQLAFFQKHVGGFVDATQLTDDLCVIHNEDFDQLSPTTAWMESGKILKIFNGSIAVVRKSNGEIRPLSTDDMKVVARLLHPLSRP